MAAIFDDPKSLPEVDASAFDAATLARAIETHGALIVRNLLPRTVVEELDAAVRNTFTAMDNRRPEKGVFEPRGEKELAEAHNFAAHVGCALMVCSPATLSKTLAAYEQYGVIDILTQHLGERPVLSSKKATLRRTSPKYTSSDVWHQDGAFIGGDPRVLNIWLALTDCGVTSASVELSTERFPAVIPPDYGVAVLADTAARLSPATVTPICAPGDALLFDHLCLHRTSMSPAYIEERRALEAWFFAPSSYPVEYDTPVRF